MDEPYEERSQTPQYQGPEEPDSLKRLRAPSGEFGSPVPFDVLGTGAASSASDKRTMPPVAAPGMPLELAVDGLPARQTLKGASLLAHGAPKKAEAADYTLKPTRVADNLFLLSGTSLYAYSS